MCRQALRIEGKHVSIPSDSKESPSRKIVWRRHLGRLILILAAAGLLWLGWYAWLTWRCGERLRADLSRLEALASGNPAGQDLGEALAIVSALRADLDALAEASRPFLALAPHLGWLPELGPTVRAVPHLLECTQHLLRAGEMAVDALGPALDHPEEGLSPQRLAELLAETRDQWPLVQQALEAGRLARERVDAESLHPRLQGLLARLDHYLPLLEAGAKGAYWAPALLGIDEARTYLILVQNEDELRATGGFISGAALVKVQDGKVTELSFEDSYAVDDLRRPYPPPPQPLRDFMAVEQLLFRDSNWSPDFPTTAEVAMTLYAMGKGRQADGVIALDQRAIAMLIEGLGALQVEGYPHPVRGENVLEVAKEAWAPKAGITEEWWEHRKDFMAGLMRAALRRLEEDPDQVEWAKLAGALWQALQERHILVFVRDGGPAEWLQAQGWDGALQDTPGDFLMVLDTNMGFNKVNALVGQSLEYLVDLSYPEEPRAELRVRHTHPLQGWQEVCRQEARYDITYAQMTQRCYWNYLRVLAPRGSVLLEGRGHPVPAEALLSGKAFPGSFSASEEDGRQVFATLLLLAPGQTIETRLSYRLPADILEPGDGRYVYSLTVRKQPGTEAVPIRVMVVLPADAKVLEVVPTPAAKGRSTLTFELRLITDQTLRVEWAVLGSGAGR